MQKTLLLLGALPLLAACGNSVNKPAGPQPINSLSGKIQGWTAGAGTLQLYSENAAGSPGVIGTGSISADGTISGALPTASQVGGYLRPASELGSLSGADCSSSVKASVAANLATVPIFRTQVNGAAVTQVYPGGVFASSQISYQVLFYADQAVNISGQEQCTVSGAGQTTTLTYSVNLNLAAGWNVADVQTTSTLGQGSTSFQADTTYTSAAALAASWVTGPSVPVSVQSNAGPQFLH